MIHYVFLKSSTICHAYMRNQSYNMKFFLEKDVLLINKNHLMTANIKRSNYD